MGLRRPSLKSTLYMILLAAGMLAAGFLIFRGAGAPVEPARTVAPTDQILELAAGKSYAVYTEQVIVPVPTASAELKASRVVVRITDPAGRSVELGPAGWGGWLFKFLTRQRGYTVGVFKALDTGGYRLEAEVGEPVVGKDPYRALLAVAPLLSVGRFLWLLVGFSGQVFFCLRFLVQWLASEKAGRSMVPRVFWYYSFFGGLMILAYAAYTRDPVFMLAYAFNTFIYLRNLMLLRREREGEQEVRNA